MAMLYYERRKKRKVSETQTPEPQHKSEVLLLEDKVEVRRKDESLKGSLHLGIIVGGGSSNDGLVPFVRKKRSCMKRKKRMINESQPQKQQHKPKVRREDKSLKGSWHSVLKVRYVRKKRSYDRKKKHKRNETQPPKQLKPNVFLFGDKVEVWREDESLKGSWNSGIIVGGGGSDDGLFRYVRYDHLILVDGSTKHSISISSNIDETKHFRGLIRPVPPPRLIDNNVLDLHYGLCVDVYSKNAWWEGVVFDYEDGCEQRLVFFPDLGDQQKVSTEQIRITQYWNQVSGNWSLSGNWLFLELIEEKKKGLLITLSDNEIWSIVKANEDFDKKVVDWTCPTRSLWDVLVSEVVREICSTIENDQDIVEVQDEVHLPKTPDEGTEQTVRTQPIFDSAEFIEDVDLTSEVDLTASQDKISKSSDSVEIVLENQVDHTPPFIPQNEITTCASGLPLDLKSPDPASIDDSRWMYDILMEAEESLVNTISSQDLNLADNRMFRCNAINGETPRTIDARTTEDNQNRDDQTSDEPHDKHSAGTRHSTWQSAVGTEMLPRAEYCPDVLQRYLQTENCSRKSEDKNDIGAFTEIRKHLACMGWKIEFKQNELESMYTLRYIAPDGKTIYTLFEACKYSFEVTRRLMNQVSQIRHQSLGAVHDKMLDCNHPRDFLSVDHKIHGDDGEACISQDDGKQNTDLDLSEEESQPVNSGPDAVAIEAEYCPQAVLDWTEIGSDKGKVKLANQNENTKSMTLRAKKHLVAVGWRLWYITKMKNRRELRYTSPKKKTYISLVTACKACIEQGLLYGDAQPR
ncbi:Phd finger transcription factor [Thalictrum thalictroides]|uniref:Phd finger transcription factor n=1 Tax=Thalictrum thalictroides TaxID=46969 RepID=A0A7J6WS71_THATH|nr:Phd finger transcription factor [Thalictrum thalictroides]